MGWATRVAPHATPCDLMRSDAMSGGARVRRAHKRGAHRRRAARRVGGGPRAALHCRDAGQPDLLALARHLRTALRRGRRRGGGGGGCGRARGGDPAAGRPCGQRAQLRDPPDGIARVRARLGRDQQGSDGAQRLLPRCRARARCERGRGRAAFRHGPGPWAHPVPERDAHACTARLLRRRRPPHCHRGGCGAGRREHSPHAQHHGETTTAKTLLPRPASAPPLPW